MSSKTAVVVLSDPSTGSDEALGRVFDALATAWEFAQGDSEALVLFQGTGTRRAPRGSRASASWWSPATGSSPSESRPSDATAFRPTARPAGFRRPPP